MKRIPFFLLATAMLGFSSLFAGGIKSKLGIGFGISSQKLYGDARTGTFEVGAAPVNFRYNMTPTLFFDTDIAYAQSNVAFGTGVLSMDMANIGAKVGYRLLSERRFNPLLYVGFGAIYFEGASGLTAWDGYGSVGAGAEFFLTGHLGLNVNGDYRYTTGDDFDGLNASSGNDAFFNVGAGLNYYFGGKPGARDFDDYVEAPVEEIMPMGTDQQGSMNATTQTNVASSEEYAMMSFKKNQLLDSIRQRDRDIQLLKAKVAVLDRHAEELTHRIQKRGQSAGNRSGKNARLVYYKNALMLYRAGYYENAANSLSTLVNEDPSNSLAGSWWYWLGESYYNLGEFDAAAVAFEQAGMLTQNTSRTEMIRLMHGLSRWKAGAVDDARRDFEKVLAENPNGQFEEIAKEYLADMKVN